MTGTSLNDFTQEPSHAPAPLRHAKRPLPSFESWALTGQTAIVTLMLAISVPSLITDTGPVAMAKALLLAAGGGLTSYAANRLAIEKGAPLAARGFAWATIFSPLSVMAIGGALFMSTFSGLVLKEVGTLQLQAHGSALSAHVASQNAMRIEAAGVGPAVRTVEKDLREKRSCEEQSSCLSESQFTGEGTVTLALGALAGKARIVAEEFESGETKAGEALDELNQMLADYQAVLAKPELDVWQKRADLAGLHGRIEQKADELAQSLPVALLASYAAELQAGVSIPDRAEATGRINAILRGHALNLGVSLDALDEGGISLPPYPSRPGVSDTLQFIPQFASIAGIVFVAEMVLPVTLWLFTFLQLSWRLEQAAGPANPQPRRSPFDDLTAPPQQLPPPVKAVVDPDRPKRRYTRRQPT